MSNLKTQKTGLKDEFGLEGNVKKRTTAIYVLQLLLTFVINMMAAIIILGFFVPNKFLSIAAAILVIALGVFSNTPVLQGLYKKLSNIEEAPPEVESRVRHILEPIIERAGIPMPTISIMNIDCLNACAFGKSDVAVTIPILSIPDDALAGVLAHEVGHLRNMDSVKSIRICTMNFPLMLLQKICGIFIWVFTGIGKLINLFNFAALPFVFISLLFGILQVIPEKIGLFLSRQQEFEADAATVEFGQGENFIVGMTMIDENKKPGIIARLRYFWSSTHPPTYDRIERVKKLISES